MIYTLSLSPLLPFKDFMVTSYHFYLSQLLLWLPRSSYYGYHCLVTMATLSCYHVLPLSCYHGYHCLVTMITTGLVPQLPLFYYHGYYFVVTMVTNVLLSWIPRWLPLHTITIMSYKNVSFQRISTVKVSKIWNH